MDLSNLSGAQWGLIVAFICELVGLILIGSATRDQVKAWRERTSHYVEHLKVAAHFSVTGTDTVTASDGDHPTDTQRIDTLETGHEQVRKDLQEHIEREHIERVTAIRNASQQLSSHITEQIELAVKPVTEWLDATSKPWKAYLGATLLIGGLAISTFVNYINLQP